MSEDKRKKLSKTLSSLSNEDKAWVINFLVQGLFNISTKRKARKVNRKDEFTEEQWEEYFEHKPVVSLPDETMPLKDVLRTTSGRAIKQMEKWL